MSDIEGELLSLKWNNHRSTFLQVVGDLRSKASFTDATLACNGKFYPVHRLVLSSCSDYFSAIFDHTTCKSPVVVLKDIESKNLEYLLDYMYIGEVNVRQHELGALVGAAECLKIKGLAVPDDNSSQNHDSGSKSRLLYRNRSSSPPNKRKRLSKYLDAPKISFCGRRTSDNSSETSNQSEVVNNIKSEPNDPDDGDTLGQDNHIVNQNIQSSPIRDQNLESNRDGTCKVIDKEEPVDVDDDKSPSAGGNLIYDSEDQSWKCEDGFHSDLVDFMTGTVTSEPSCSSQQEDQHLVRRIRGKLGTFSTKNSSITGGDHWIEVQSDCSNESYSSTTALGNGDLCASATFLNSGSKDGARYFCQYCNHSTMYKGNLIRHIRIHTGVKPFKCQFCDCRYSDQTMLRNHYKSRHSEGAAAE